MKKAIPLIIVTLPLFCMTLLPGAQAVHSCARCGYPNFTTAEGTNALKNLTSGAGNTATGWYSLFTTSSGSLQSRRRRRDARTEHRGRKYGGWHRRAFTQRRRRAKYSRWTGHAFKQCLDGSSNTAVGDRALFSNTTGDVNTATGSGALSNNFDGKVIPRWVPRHLLVMHPATSIPLWELMIS